MNKRVNLDTAIWAGVLILIFYSFTRMIYSGDIKNFIHPDMIKYAVFGTIAIFIMILYNLGEVLKGRHSEKIKYGYILFLIPVLIYLFLKPSGLSESTALNRGVNLLFYKVHKDEGDKQGHVHSHGDGKINIKNGTIMVEDSNFFTSVEQVFNNVEAYKSNKLTIKGFVLKEKNSNKTFILSRMVVSCCAADTEVIGIRCEYKYAENLRGGQWVELLGTLKEQKDDAVPILSVEKSTVIEKPQDNYIYRD